MMQLNTIQRGLVDGWQKGLPLEPTPFANMAYELGVSELTVLGTLKELARNGVLSRVGAVVAPNTAGASTLAAMAAPAARLREVADIINAEPGVNHNYEREHNFNLWFVVTGRSRASVNAALARIERRTGLRVLNLPLRTAYHIDLGFGSKLPCERRGRTRNGGPAAPTAVEDRDLVLLQAIEDGLPIVSRPFAEIARQTGEGELDVIDRLDRLTACGVIKRLGLVVRHRELGYVANAMVVWDIDDGDVDGVGDTFADLPFVTLCYRRDRQRPDWPYNLFCMIHGRDRETVLGQVDQLRERVGPVPMDVLFSQRRFKQHGARLSAA